MEKYKYLENLNERKVKLKEYKKQAEEFLKTDANDVFSVEDENKEHISEDLFLNNPCCYINPTETLITSSYLKEGDSFATVLGSGDFALDALKQKPKEILAFDVNKFQIPMGNLKLLGLQQMSYEDFCNFFVDSTNPLWFSPYTYEQLKKSCSKDELFAFWDTIMEQRKKDQKKLFSHPYYQAIHTDNIELLDEDMRRRNSEYIINHNIEKIEGTIISLVLNKIMGARGATPTGSYLENEESYNLAKENLKDIDIRFIRSDINRLNSVLSSTKYFKENFSGFDKIYLSNIPEYLNSSVFYETVDSQLVPLLKEDGEIIFCCQGVSADTLTKANPDELKKMQRETSIFAKRNTPALICQTINDIEAFKMLKLCGGYDLTTTSVPTYGRGNGFDNVDTFVKIKRK